MERVVWSHKLGDAQEEMNALRRESGFTGTDSELLDVVVNYTDRRDQVAALKYSERVGR